MLNDVPISRWDASAGSDWQPKNSPPQYAGPIRLRQGLGQSKNVVMVRAMRAMGVDYAAEYLQRFGFPAQNIVHTESLALGSAFLHPNAGGARLRGHGERRLPGGPVVYQQN